jgi:large subunit ribosomal protein L15
MKLHDLRPAPGSHKAKRRVGRGIASGQGKTAGRGTKGQKARAGGSIPAWFEGGQTPLHQRIPKLHGFRNPFRIEYEVVNVGAIAHLVELGILESGEMPGGVPKRAKSAPAPLTVNQEILRAAGLVRTLNRPMKILGAGELSTALFVVADAFSASARSKIEGAGGSVSVLEVPKERKPAVGVTPPAGPTETEAAPATETEAAPAPEAGAVESETGESEATPAAKAAPAAEATETPSATGEPPEAADVEDAAPSDPTATTGAAAPSISAPKPKARAPRKAKTPAPDAEA